MNVNFGIENKTSESFKKDLNNILDFTTSKNEDDLNKFQKFGKIYKIVSNKGDKIYIGSCYSSKYISDRMGAHRQGYLKYKAGIGGYCSSYELFDLYGVENCSIKLIEHYKCNNKQELHAREGVHILENKDICVNKNMAGRSREQYFKDVAYKSQKKYYLKNKEKICQYKKEYDRKKREAKKNQEEK